MSEFQVPIFQQLCIIEERKIKRLRNKSSIPCDRHSCLFNLSIILFMLYNLMEKSSHNLSKSQEQFDESISVSQQRLNDLHSLVFNHCKIDNYKLNYVLVGSPNQSIYTLFIPSMNPDVVKKGPSVPTFYIGHGFGGTSLMFFPVFSHILQHANIVLWQIRGMGFSKKNEKYPQKSLSQIEEYFLVGVNAVLNFYRHRNVIMLTHSLSAYLALLHRIKIKQSTVNKFILLSPVGLTRKQDDYKRKIKSCSDLFTFLGHKFSWIFKLTYKSYLRTICCCCKDGLLENEFKDYKMSAKEKEIMKEIFLSLIDGLDGSQTYFFKYFLPRVIPQISIQQELQNKIEQIEVYCYHGGRTDWVDKKAVTRFSLLYPNRFHFKDIQNGSGEDGKEGPGHMILFDPQIVKKIIRQSTFIQKQQVFQKMRRS